MSASNNDSRICYNNHTHTRTHNTHPAISNTRGANCQKKFLWNCCCCCCCCWHQLASLFIPFDCWKWSNRVYYIVQMCVTGRRRRGRPPKVKTRWCLSYSYCICNSFLKQGKGYLTVKHSSSFIHSTSCCCCIFFCVLHGLRDSRCTLCEQGWCE